MNARSLARFRARLAASEPVYGMWVTLEAPSLTEIAVGLDMDWVVVDAEHGHLDWKEIAEHVRGAVRSDTVVLVRVAELNASLIKRTLDIGADGVVIPWVETAQQLREAIAFSRYPPEGRRGIGAERATAWGQAIADHARVANEQVLVVPIIESVRALPEVSRMAAVEGAEIFFFGPADFSASAGYRGEWEGPGVAEQILTAQLQFLSAGKHCGVMATSIVDLLARREQGFQMLGVGSDTGLLLRGLKETLRAVDRDRPLRADLSLDPQPHLSAEVTRTIVQADCPSAGAARPDIAFRLALTADFFTPAGEPRYPDMGLDILAKEPAIAVERLASHQAEIDPDQLAGLDGVLVLTPRVTAASLARADNLLVVARFGVGYDGVDVAACTARDVALTITAGAVDRPVAEATVGWLLALTHHMLIKDRLVREARWDDRSRYMGSELRDRTLGLVGCGGIGRTVVRLLAGFGMRPPLVFDPYLDPALIASAGCRAVRLEELLAAADFVSLHCPLNEQTRGLIGARELALMKPSAYLVNTARGGVVDEEALYRALAERRIAGAAIDCFDSEPLVEAPKFAALENVLLAPHAIAWTDELFRDIGQMAFQGLIDLVQGRRPHGVMNPEVFDRPGFQAKWQRVVNRAS